MSEDPKLVKWPSLAERKIAELQQALQQIGNRLLQTSPEAQNLLGQIAAWKEISTIAQERESPAGDLGGAAGVSR